jgi:hypothetical protein
VSTNIYPDYGRAARLYLSTKAIMAAHGDGLELVPMPNEEPPLAGNRKERRRQAAQARKGDPK